MAIGSHSKPNKGLSDSWITPKHIIDALGPFDLDPCACSPQPWQCAKTAFTIHQDGLSQPWNGRVWLNPPYSEVWTWISRLSEHGSGTALIFARTETAGFINHVWNKASAILFLHGRLHFHHPDGSRAKGNSGGPSCLIAYSHHDAQRLLTSNLDGTVISCWKQPSTKNKNFH